MLLPPTRAAVRPLAGALAARSIARQVAFVNLNGITVPGPGRGDYIDGEVVEVFDADPATNAPNPFPPAVIQRKPE